MRLPIVLALALAAASLGGCLRHSYAGVSLRPGEAPAELQALAQRGQGGDKQAQLDLGIRFEEGQGVPVNLRRAVRLYRAAAGRSGGTIMIYVPPVGDAKYGTVMPVNTGPVIPGLPEAAARLRALEARLERGR